MLGETGGSENSLRSNTQTRLSVSPALLARAGTGKEAGAWFTAGVDRAMAQQHCPGGKGAGMNLSIRRIFVVLLKGLLALFVFLVLIIAGLMVYSEMTKRPPGSPPPGSEGRLKYDLNIPPGPYSSKQAPVDLWFGRRDGQYDTTHLRITKDYFGIRPRYHGQAAHINTIWPSLLSTHEYGRLRKKAGLPYERSQELTLIISETRSVSGTDKSGTAPVMRCEPMVRDEARGVKYCHENRSNEMPGERWTNYWPLDESIQTPWYKNPPRFRCNVVERQGVRSFDGCASNFSYNADVDVTMLFVPESLAIDILTDFPRLIEFLTTLEVTP
ncbi:MAG: hypothetical protein KZQ97_09435 [Candidatus Thiodiazotropha sp. (ex Dulcina madagascariensis)]|nr:hypothetical protein [Candidatus Thiodiazotropha sp. (ex Dulcina madagascariensis)]